MRSIPRSPLPPPVRSFIRRTHANPFGQFPTRKNDTGAVEFESLLEKDFLIHMEVHPSVVGIAHQPKTFIWEDGERAHNHIPDFLIRLRDGSDLYVEIKESRKATLPEVEARTRIMTRKLANEGSEYWLLTEHWIRRKPDFPVAALILHGGQHSREIKDYRNKIRAVLTQFNQESSIRLLCQNLPPTKKEHLQNIVCAAIMDGTLELIRPDPKVLADSIVRLREGPLWPHPFASSKTNGS